jgi:hypothetical protein
MGMLALYHLRQRAGALLHKTQSFAWTEEFSVFLMILLAMVAGSASVARDRHIRIEYFCGERLDGAGASVCRSFGAVLVAACCFSLIAVLCTRTYGVRTTSGLKKPPRASVCRSGGIRSGCPSMSTAIALRACWTCLCGAENKTTTRGASA